MASIQEVPVGDMDDYLHWLAGASGALALTGAGTLAVAAAYYATRPTPCKVTVDLNMQSQEEEGPEMVRTSKLTKEAKEGKFMRHLYEDAKTIYAAFRRGAKESNNGNCLGWRDGPGKPYQWLNYNETLLRAHNFGSGLVSLGLSPGTDTFVGVYSQNCPEWILCEQGLYCYSMVIVPLYDTLGPDACAFIIQQAQISLVVCENDAKIQALMSKAPSCLKHLVTIKEPNKDTVARAKAMGIAMHHFTDIERIGAHHDFKEKIPTPEDLSTVCYTSGTTGHPKGVMLTHGNIIASVSATLVALGEFRPCKTDVMISFLPLAHMLERSCQVAVYVEGGAVGFYSGNIQNLSDDMKVLRPTLTPTVPRLLNRIYDKVRGEVKGSGIKRLLLKMALAAKEAEINRGVIRNNSMWDTIVFRKVREAMGGRIRLLVVGSAPLAGNVLTFVRCALGCVVVEGYGQTECTAPCTLNVPGDATPEHVGPPLPCNVIKLADVPEMEYYASGGQGEVCVKGANVFIGYYKDPERMKDTVDQDGWLHTGDIGMWLPNGALKIIDRKKHIFKLSQGEYIAPEKIENIYVRSQYVSQLFVHGESLKSCIVAIVVPSVETLKNWAVENGISGTLSVLCANPDVKNLIMDDMVNLGKDAGLKSFEQVKDIYLHPDPFSIQNGLLTPTLKSKRPELKKYFKPQIEDMYTKLA